ncbi:MAG: hypothetical protein PVH63_03700 [Balneolaceae bacterium]
MIDRIKQRLFHGWHPMRWLALGFGCFVGYQAIVYKDIFSGLLALFFLYQAATNSGCMVGGCPTPESNSANKSGHSDVSSEQYSNIEFTEVENKA